MHTQQLLEGSAWHGAAMFLECTAGPAHGRGVQGVKPLSENPRTHCNEAACKAVLSATERSGRLVRPTRDAFQYELIMPARLRFGIANICLKGLKTSDVAKSPFMHKVDELNCLTSLTPPPIWRQAYHRDVL